MNEPIEIPEECENTLAHLEIHLRPAERGAENDDWDMLAHDLAMIEAFAHNMLINAEAKLAADRETQEGN